MTFSVAATAFDMPEFLKLKEVTKGQLIEMLGDSQRNVIGDFPFFVLDRDATTFDVCDEGGKFRVDLAGATNDRQYVRSTYKQCTDYIWGRDASGELQVMCDPDSLEEVAIKLRHKVRLYRYMGENIERDTEYRNLMVSTVRRFDGVPEFFVKYAGPDEFSEDVIGHRDVYYTVPDCK